jgi:hypothetical protein
LNYSYSKCGGGFTTRVRVCRRTTSSSCTSTSTALEACALVLSFGIAFLAFGGAVGSLFYVFSNAFTLLAASLASLFSASLGAFASFTTCRAAALSSAFSFLSSSFYVRITFAEAFFYVFAIFFSSSSSSLAAN